LYGEIRNFSALPLETKRNEIQVLEVSEVCFFGTEHAKGRKEGDLKEFWHLVSM
jgi:hypothetical protein